MARNTSYDISFPISSGNDRNASQVRVNGALNEVSFGSIPDCGGTTLHIAVWDATQDPKNDTPRFKGAGFSDNQAEQTTLHPEFPPVRDGWYVGILADAGVASDVSFSGNIIVE